MTLSSVEWCDMIASHCHVCLPTALLHCEMYTGKVLYVSFFVLPILLPALCRFVSQLKKNIYKGFTHSESVHNDYPSHSMNWNDPECKWTYIIHRLNSMLVFIQQFTVLLKACTFTIVWYVETIDTHININTHVYICIHMYMHTLIIYVGIRVSASICFFASAKPLRLR